MHRGQQNYNPLGSNTAAETAYYRQQSVMGRKIWHGWGVVATKEQKCQKESTFPAETSEWPNTSRSSSDDWFSGIGIVPISSAVGLINIQSLVWCVVAFWLD